MMMCSSLAAMAYAAGANSSIFRHRLSLFFRDFERGKRVQVELCPTLASPQSDCLSGDFNQSDVSSPAGIFSGLLTVPLQCPELHEDGFSGGKTLWLRTTRSPGQGGRDMPAPVHVVGYSGVSIVSDIDDTIKETGVKNISRTLSTTLLRPFEHVPGMSSFYRSLKAQSNSAEDVHFHFVSSSPWLLANELFDWIVDPAKEGGKFPSGSMHLKTFRLELFEPWGLDVSMFNLVNDPTAFKVKTIEKILANFPGRRFVFIGDSSEKDPDVYGIIARKYPRRTLCVAIRNVTGNFMTASRLDEAFAGVDRGKFLTYFDGPPKDLFSTGLLVAESCG